MCKNAGIAQLVERNLAKVEVASSSLVSRSKLLRIFMAGWQSGYAAACKAVDAGSIPTPASSLAQVVKQVDTRDLKSLDPYTVVPVRFRPWAPNLVVEFCGNSSVGRAQPCQG